MELLKRISLSVFVIAIVLLAVIMGGLRLAIMNIDFFKSEIEYLLDPARSVSAPVYRQPGGGDRFLGELA